MEGQGVHFFPGEVLIILTLSFFFSLLMQNSSSDWGTWGQRGPCRGGVSMDNPEQRLEMK